MAGAGPDKIEVAVDFTGGLEILFSNRRELTVEVPARAADGGPATIQTLIEHLCEQHMDDPREDLFVIDGRRTVRPGILVLINDADWELEGEEKYELQSKDRVTFMSTLHGG